MISLSEFVVVGVFEAFLVVFVGVVMLLFYNYQLRSQLASTKNTVQKLKQSAIKLQSKLQAPKDKGYLPGISKELKNTMTQFESVAQGEPMSLNMACSKSQTAALRHLFLTSELTAAASSNSETKWLTLESNFEPVAKLIAAPPPPAPPTLDIFDRNHWADLTDAARRVLVDGSIESQEQLAKIIQTTSRNLGFDEAEIPQVNPVPAARSAEEAKNSLNAAQG